MKAIDHKTRQNRQLKSQPIRQKAQRVKPKKHIICVKSKNTAHIWAVDINKS